MCEGVLLEIDKSYSGMQEISIFTIIMTTGGGRREGKKVQIIK
jgi:hypothetical protein